RSCKPIAKPMRYPRALARPSGGKAVSVMPSPVTPEARQSRHSIKNAHGAWNRLAGLGLTLIALGPILVIAIGIALTVFSIIDLVRHTSAGIATVAGIVESRISPQVAKVESAFNSLATPLSQLRDDVNGAMTAFDHVGNIQIAKGAWGATPSVHVKIPPVD